MPLVGNKITTVFKFSHSFHLDARCRFDAPNERLDRATGLPDLCVLAAREFCRFLAVDVDLPNLNVDRFSA